VAGVERAGGGMHRFRDELSVGRETEERRDKVFGY
jgi:hypothetical protein